MHVRFESASELDDHLACGSKEDTFEYRGPDRVVHLENDCRRYPLRLTVEFVDMGEAGGLGAGEGKDAASTERKIYAFIQRIRERYDVEFTPYLAEAVTARIPGLAVKIVAYFSLGEIQVVFSKRSPHAERRRIIGWGMG
jgi:hypothetical protein